MTIRSNIYMEIRLPDWEHFQASKYCKVRSPLHKLYIWTAKKFGPIPRNHQIDVSALKLHPEDYEKLSHLVKQWIRQQRFGDDDFFDNYIEKKYLPWIMFDLGPGMLTEEELNQGRFFPGNIYVIPPITKPRGAK